MSIRLVTMDGGHVTPEIDSFLYRALMPRIAPTGSAEDIPAVADYLLYGGKINPIGRNVYVQKAVILGCGRIIEIPDSESIQAPSGTSGKSTNYTLVFRIQPSATNASDRVKAVFVPENGTFYANDISTGTGIYDVKFAAVSVDETGWPDYVECILPKMPVLINNAAETKMEIDGQICVPTAEGVRKFVWAQDYFSKSSTVDRLWLLQLVGDIVKVGGYFTTTEPTEELDDLLSAYSVYYQLNGVKNSELWELFNCNAEGAFVSAFTYQGEEDGHEYSKTVQIAIPCALSLTKFEFANIATRTKTSNSWTEWNIAGELDYTAIRNQLLATKLPSDITLDTLGDAYSVYFSLSDSENVDLYNAFKGQAIGAFVSATYVRDETETVYAFQRAVPVVPLDADSDVPCVATRSKIHGGKWSVWNTSGSGTGTGDSEIVEGGVGKSGNIHNEIFNDYRERISEGLKIVQGNVATGEYSHAEGERTTANGKGSHAEGIGATASGDMAHAEGNSSIASGSSSHAEGFSFAGGDFSHSEGMEGEAKGYGSHAEGIESVSEGRGSHAEGIAIRASGEAAHAEGYQTHAEGDRSHAEGCRTTAKGDASHAEGSNYGNDGKVLPNKEISSGSLNTTISGSAADGISAHAEGAQTYAYGYASHAEGFQTQAMDVHCHAEGDRTTADGLSCHAEGCLTTAKAAYTHAEGFNTLAESFYAHAEGNETTATGAASHSEGTKTVAEGGNSHAEGFQTVSQGNSSHSEGYKTSAQGKASHAEGGNLDDLGEALPDKEIVIGNYTTTISGSTAEGINSHAEGTQTYADGWGAHAEGIKTQVSGDGAHAEGSETVAEMLGAHAEGVNTQSTSLATHAEGYGTVASGMYAHAEGEATEATGARAHSEGDTTTASGRAAHAEGGNTEASGMYSHAGGYYNKAKAYQRVIGNFADTESSTEKGGLSSPAAKTGSLYVIGNGTDTARSNAFRVAANGQVYGQGAYNTNGADYAEYFEWLDGNPDNEDRRGLFVTLDGEKIRPAKADDTYILGIVSAAPSVAGDAHSETWKDMYLRDVFGEYLTETVTVPKYINELTGEKVPEHTVTRWILNPDYDPEQKYISRKFRKEWSAVGIMGKLVVVDDGTCQVNGYCSVSDGGTATASETGYRVLARLDDAHIKILLK